MEGIGDIKYAGSRTTLPQDVDFADLYEGFLGVAKRIIEQGQELVPVFLLFKKQELMTLLIPMEDEQAKDDAVTAVRNFIRKTGIEAVAVVMEAWISKIPKEKLDSTGTPPKDDPDRQEAVVMIIQSTDGLKELWRVPFIRIGQEVIFEEPNKTDKVEGRFANFF